jgi:hypothetical protein
MSVALASAPWQREGRALLILGRVSNLPTVWSNCLAGWMLGGGGTLRRFGLLCLGASFLYLGGMFLNDAFDVEFDSQHRSERPIPSGAISPGKVWGWGLGWLLSGVLLLSLLGRTALALSLVLIACIVLYDAIHKAVTLSPLIMAACRLFLYLLASAAAENGVHGLAIWSALALALYVVGLSFLARAERPRSPVTLWPVWLLAGPILLALIANAGEFRLRALLLSTGLAIWIVRCLGETFWMTTRSVGRTVSGLLAGICLVDLLATLGGGPLAFCCLMLLFALALVAQRFVPAT